MQINRLSNNFKPLVLSVGLAAVPASFAYADIDSVEVKVTSPKINDYINLSSNSDGVYYFIKSKFQLHLQQWEENTMLLSSVSQIVEDENFQAIVAMGKLATPFILEELSKKPSTLVWALNLIYGKKISEKKDLTISEACKLWIKSLSNNC